MQNPGKVKLILKMNKKKHFQLFVDTGGTFTDCIGIDETGKQHRRKVLSSSSLRGTITKIITGNKNKLPRGRAIEVLKRNSVFYEKPAVFQTFPLFTPR